MSSRALTQGERALAASIFGAAIDYARVRIHSRKYWPFQPRSYTMAPDGHLWFHPHGDLYCADFEKENLTLQGHFIHEMTHVWQAQVHGKWFLPLRRHPWCRYTYALEPGKPFARYGIEQQAEIVRHAFLYRRGVCAAGAPPQDALEALLPFNV